MKKKYFVVMIILINNQKQKVFFSKPDSLVELYFLKKSLKYVSVSQPWKLKDG